MALQSPANNNNNQQTPEHQVGAPPNTMEDENAVDVALKGLLVAKSEAKIKQDFGWQREKG